MNLLQARSSDERIHFKEIKDMIKGLDKVQILYSENKVKFTLHMLINY